MMYPIITTNRTLYGAVIVLCLILVVSALGGGLFQQGGFWMGDLQHRAFRMLCHQDPARSFWINGKPMAVCARCFGIYAGFSLLWLGMPMLALAINIIKEYSGKIFLAAMAVNVIDVVVNMLGFWQNTLTSRTITGAFIGIAAVLFLADKFIISTSKTDRRAYGINRTTDIRSL